MAATSRRPGQTAKVIRLPRPLRTIANRTHQKRLPALSSDEIDKIFDNVDCQDNKLTIAA